MKKKIILVIVLVGFIVCLYVYFNFRYVKFYEVNFDAENYVVSKQNSSPIFYTNLKKVLGYYGEDFEEREGVVHVRGKLFNDKELMYNYTKKAKDSIWLSTR